MKKTSGYAPVNGLEMYYEVGGDGDPLVFIPPAFGFAGLKSFPALAKTRAIITMDLQGNGRTPDIPDRPITIEQYAEDVIALLARDIQESTRSGRSGNCSPEFARRLLSGPELAPEMRNAHPALLRKCASSFSCAGAQCALYTGVSLGFQRQIGA